MMIVTQLERDGDAIALRMAAILLRFQSGYATIAARSDGKTIAKRK
jgi:hypothetical protein